MRLLALFADGPKSGAIWYEHLRQSPKLAGALRAMGYKLMIKNTVWL